MKRIFTYITVAATAALCVAIMPSKAEAATTNGDCHNVTVPVALANGLPANKIIAGTLCTPYTWAENSHQVDVLVHGATYNRSYWDWPTNGTAYSYVDKTLGAGRATFTYDRLGAGTSSRPVGALVTLEADAHALHQVVSWLRATHHYSQVNTIGHSLGSNVTIQEAGTYQDVDRVVVTGILHNSGFAGFLNASHFYPAMLDPAFFGLLDPTYLTTLPNSRGGMFYNAATVDPGVIAYDETHKDKFATTELVGSIPLLQGPAAGNISTQITAPVLTVVGELDALVCMGNVDCTSDTVLTANEAPYYADANSSMAVGIAQTGHNLPLHPSADSSFATINQWINSH